MAQAGFEPAGAAPHLNSAEQNLLLNALKSNQPASTGDDTTLNPQADASFLESLNDSSFLDSHFDTSNFNWDLDSSALGPDGQDNGADDSANSADGDEGSSNEQPGDKRKERSGDLEEGGKKRRDSEEKSAKKPGRKPLTNEPTSKRKAQNRAAQRAFRERKEKHLRDLEQKVDDLEKASEATNHENGVLRAQVDRLNAEVTEYKKRLGTLRPTYSPTQPINTKMNWDIGQNFDFEFPKFGVNNSNNGNKSNVTTTTPSQKTPAECVLSLNSLQNLDKLEKRAAERDFFRSASSLAWSPSFTETRSMSTDTAASTYFENSRRSIASARSPTSVTDKSLANSESPASLALGSSVCTTPEATADSPGQYKNDKKAMSYPDFRASASPSQPKTPAQDSAQGLDWFTNQNNGLFDPILIEAYREPQDNILNNADLNLSFFDDAFPWNPASNYSAPFSNSALEATGQSKSSLLDKVDKAAEGEQHDSFRETVVTDSDNRTRQITCAKLWDRVQRSEKVLSGEADMDDLCSQLKAKAKCGGPNKGAVVDEADVDAILGPDPARNKKKGTGMYGMFS